MANIISSSGEPALDYLEAAFRKPQYDARVQQTRYQYLFPISGSKNTTCLRWVIRHQKGMFVPDLSKMVLALDLKCTNRNRTSTPPLDINSGPCNNFMNSIFSTLRISYNTTTVLRIEHFPIFSYVRLMLNSDNNDLGTWAATRCFYQFCNTSLKSITNLVKIFFL